MASFKQGEEEALMVCGKYHLDDFYADVDGAAGYLLTDCFRDEEQAKAVYALIKDKVRDRAVRIQENLDYHINDTHVANVIGDVLHEVLSVAKNLCQEQEALNGNRMTKNQYQDYLKELASRLHADPEYSLADYQRDADAVEVLGFALDSFPLSDADRHILDKMFESEDKDRHGNLLLRGHVIDRGFVNLIANTLECQCECDKFYNGFYSHHEKRCVLEFCEGDISLVLCETEEAYKEALASHREFYGLEVAEAPRLDGIIKQAEQAVEKNSAEKDTKCPELDL